MSRIEACPDHRSDSERLAHENWEMSLAGALVNVVDTLFTYRPIAEKLQGTEQNEAIQTFLRHWKQSLAQQLEATAWLEVQTFLADFEHRQAGQEPSFSPTPSET